MVKEYEVASKQVVVEDKVNKEGVVIVAEDEKVKQQAGRFARRRHGG